MSDVALPPKLQDLLEAFELFPDPADRTGMLLSYADQFKEVPPEIARRPFDTSHLVPECESEAYVWAMKRPDDTLQLYFAVENPSGVSAKALATILDRTLSGLSANAIGRVGPTYSPNLKDLDGYYAALDGGYLPVAGGIVLTGDDLVRRAVIQVLACQFRLSIESIELAYQVDFRSYFAPELQELRRLEQDGLVELQPEGIVVTPKGRLLVRIVCMVFDRYLREGRQQARYSKVM